MRNLSLLSVCASRIPNGHENHVIRAETTDLDEDVAYVASESVVDDDVNVQIWTVGRDGELVCVDLLVHFYFLSLIEVESFCRRNVSLL